MKSSRGIAPFNSAVETGLRILALLTAHESDDCSLERLIVLDYLLVHSHDFPGGPPSLHPDTPFRGGEVLVRRNLIRAGVNLYASRGLILRLFSARGETFAASDEAAGFMDSLASPYAAALRDRATWVRETLSDRSDQDLRDLVRARLADWGAEFTFGISSSTTEVS